MTVESKAIWIRTPSLDEIRSSHVSGCDRTVGLELTEIGSNWIEGQIPAHDAAPDPTHAGRHGAIAVLAEALGSIGASLCIDTPKSRCVGQSLHIHHLESVGAGPIKGRATPISMTDTTHVWRIEVRDAAGTAVSTATLMLAVLA